MSPSPDQDYSLLIEFVHKHLDFHTPELNAILGMHGIQDCRFRSLPMDANHQSAETRRPFQLLTFPSTSIGSRFSVHDDDEGDESKKNISLVSALARCTLIRSVVELWGIGPTIDDCVRSVQSGNSLQRHRQGKHLGRAAKKYEDRTWKITVHTLGTTCKSAGRLPFLFCPLDGKASFLCGLLVAIVLISRHSADTREEQNDMRAKFSFLDFPGKVTMRDPDDEYLFIREVKLDAQGGAVYPRHSGVNREIIAENDARPPLACYFGRVLGNSRLGRNWRGSNRIEQYSLKKRHYLGPTSMDAELSLIMTNLAQIRKGSMVFDPFVGTGSILLTAALRGAYTFGTDIDLRVLRGKSQHENIASNFKQYGLRPPELVRSDNAIYHRHYRQHSPLFDAIVTDPPYGNCNLRSVQKLATYR